VVVVVDAVAAVRTPVSRIRNRMERPVCFGRRAFLFLNGIGMVSVAGRLFLR